MTKKLSREFCLSASALFCSIAFHSPASALDTCFPYSATVSSGGFPSWSYSPLEVCQKLAQPFPDRAWWRTMPVNGSGDYRNTTILGVVPSGGPNGFYCIARIETGNVQTGQVTVTEGNADGALGPGCTPIVERDKTPKPRQCSAPKFGDPIFPLDGTERFTQDLGISIGGRRVEVVYDSMRRLPYAQSGVPLYEKPYNTFGELWESSLHKRIVVGHLKKAAHALRGSNVKVSFAGNGAGSYTPDADTNDRLITTTSGFQYIDAANRAIETYDGNGYILRVDQINGRSLIYTNSTASTPVTVVHAPGFVLSVQDNFGRAVQFNYIVNHFSLTGFVKQIVGPDGNLIRINYNENSSFLDKITWQDLAEKLFGYAFLNPGPSPYWGLSSITDENVKLHATIGYDAQGRAISSELAGGVDRYAVIYTAPPSISVMESGPQPGDPSPFGYRTRTLSVPTGTVVTLPNGDTSAIGAISVQSSNVPSSKSQPAGSGCAASTSNQSYDANGNVIQRDDFNAKRTCYANDLSRNLETARVEGLANTATCAPLITAGSALPTGSRKVSTQWHPDWRLETMLAEPGRLTTKIYNGQPDPFNGNALASCAPSTALLPDGKPIVVLCKSVEQATMDVNGATGFNATLQSGVTPKTTTWTYNQFGQVLTENGPRTDVSDITTYTYYTSTTADYTLGDLKTLTNAAGRVTTYNKYNKAGQLLQSTDPNGVVTVNTYDLRQRLKTTTVGNQTTSYDYDPVGQLKKITQPDGSWLGYDYDDAHRQVAMYDNLGNRVDYTLDNAGNRTAETVKNNAAVLKRQLSRSIDALGRVQQTTGRE